MSNDVPQWLRTLLRTMHERIRAAVREELDSHEKSFLSARPTTAPAMLASK